MRKEFVVQNVFFQLKRARNLTHLKEFYRPFPVLQRLNYGVLNRCTASYAKNNLFQLKRGVPQSTGPDQAPLPLIAPTFGLPKKHSLINLTAGDIISIKHRGYFARLDQPATAILYLVNIFCGFCWH